MNTSTLVAVLMFGTLGAILVFAWFSIRSLANAVWMAPDGNGRGSCRTGRCRAWSQ